VSFDPLLSAWLLTGRGDEPASRPVHEIVIGSEEHFITALQEGGQVYPLGESLDAPDLSALKGLSLLSAGGMPFLVAASLERGRTLHWSTPHWLFTRVLGPMAGLDDLFWRGLAWAARKPFVLRGLPPIVTMRVDDVAGRGVLFDQSPLYWVENAIHSGFKPWLGLFIYNLTSQTVSQLHGMIQSGDATAFPHAFGRPPRTPEIDFPYYEDALPFRADSYDEFIYFDHQRGIPFSDAEVAKGLAAVDRWYHAMAPLPMSTVALPHWYELGSNASAHIRTKWGAEFIGDVIAPDSPLVLGVPWLKVGPYRKYEEPGDAYPHSGLNRSGRPLYYADFVNLGGSLFFNCVTEIRDVTGYEWSPDNDVQATVRRGVSQILRAIDGMALATLFTHETDFIYKIQPENWAAIMRGVEREIRSRGPIQMTLDDGIRTVRATHTSSLASCDFDAQSGKVNVRFTGSADVPTGLYLYTGEGDAVETRLVEVPAFEGEITLTL
jgi:hypothetical protein